MSLFGLLYEPERCEERRPSATNREAGQEVLSTNIYEVNILLSNLTVEEENEDA